MMRQRSRHALTPLDGVPRGTGEHECNVNPEHMMRSCPDLCGVCTLGCEDKEALCKTWAEEGECLSNKKMMCALAARPE